MLQRLELTTAARSIPEHILYYAELWMGGMFLQDEAYVYMRERRNPLASGMLYVALVGVLVGLADILGGLARYATSPSLDALKNTVLAHLQPMPFYETLGPAAQRSFDAGYDDVWNLFGSLFAGYPSAPADFALLFLSVLTTPVGLLVSWFVYGALAHLLARKWNAEISFAEILGPLALAASPQLLRVLNVFPNVGISSWVTFFWFLVCAITAIRVTYRTTTSNAFRAALFPIVVFILVAIVLVVLALILVTARGGQ